ncbi:hypothetical protein [Nonomuraea sp. LPB2021202275-12-8]|uniref:hypothetical protein n=1 Tax=Nonomuraea sp. LPB2021202275-12-8 TaxID=3120159 RepID=UPI00300BFFF0
MTERNINARNVLQKLIAQIDRSLWRRADASARSVGLRVEKASWHRRTYRDPRFDERTVRINVDRDITGGVTPMRPFRLG